MKKFRALSILLSLCIAASLVIPGAPAQTVLATDEDEGEGMVYNKSASYNEDGSYTIALEAYATGERITSGSSQDKPADIVLVLDQSGSMYNNMRRTAYRPYEGTDRQNSRLYSVRHNGGSSNLWYQNEDGSYASVSVRLTPAGEPIYEQIVNETNTYYYNHQEDSDGNHLLYALVNGQYVEVTVAYEFKFDWGNSYFQYTYKYTDSSGQEVTIVTSNRDNSRPDFSNSGIDGNSLYLKEVNYEYSYYITDESGSDIEIAKSTGAETLLTDPVLYERYTDTSTGAGNTRLDALISAVTEFTDNVQERAIGDTETSDDDVDHRIAIVGFSSSGYSNTELLTGVNVTRGDYYGSDPEYNWGTSYYYPTGYAMNGVSNPSERQYASALQDMSSQNGYDNVLTAIDALTAHGGTQTNDGLAMAEEIFANNEVSLDAEGNPTRDRVVILFTDGETDSNRSTTVQTAYKLKNEYNATVYTVGIFDGADGTPVYGSSWNGVETENVFLHLLSSNFKNANHWSSSWGDIQPSPATNTYPDGGSSYYLSASDAEALNDIFQQIAGEISSGGSSTTLDADTVIKDVVAESFILADGANTEVTLETWSYNGNDSWTNNNSPMGARYSIDPLTGTVSVTGFDFSDNWCGTDTTDGNVVYHGNKLVIKFDVVPRDGFLGGNNVPTNESAGIFKNSTETEPVFTYNVPTANVPIENVNVNASNKNVYLLGDLTVAQIQKGITVECNGVTLDLSSTAVNYGLESWQNAYVDIDVKYTDADGNILRDFSELQADTIYSVSVTIKPKDMSTTDVGPANEMTGKSDGDNGNIYVFKPELTYKDGEVWYGDYAPTEYSTYLEETQWKHGETLDSAVTMIGEEPSLELEYAPESGTITLDNKVDTKEDIAVNVTVEIDNENVTSNTTFQHTDCTGKPCGKPANGAFWLHINTCELTVAKTGGVEGEPYVFTVLKDNGTYTSLTIKGSGSVTIKELPVGSYSIQEDENWSWRYNGTEGDAVTLSSSNPYDTISCENVKDEDTWLNDYSPVIKNIYGEEQTVVNE